MNKEKAKGWFASLTLHGLLAGGLFIFSGVAAAPDEPDALKDTVLVININGDGTPAPGTGGEAIANKGKPDAPTRPAPPAPTDDSPLVHELPDAPATPEPPTPVEPEPEPVPVPVPPKPATEVVKPPKPPKPTTKPETAKPEQMTLDDFLKEKNANKKPDKSVRTSAVKKPVIGRDGLGNLKDYRAGASAGIDSDTNDNGRGTLNGGGAQLGAYEDRLKLLIQERWQKLVDERGGSLAGLSGEFRLRISNNGNLSFDGWTLKPQTSNSADAALFERLLRNAIDSVRRIGPRPAGVLSLQLFQIKADPR
ncbi:MAG: hypothetical protein LBT53_06810 [Puniceicoccales bacterium]|jgi:hypothetical protein|nr:hypothetical protein [Puniceicoccales bacterium]